MRTDQKIEWYFGWVSTKPTQESAMDALKRYMEKFGVPPSIILIPPKEELKPMDGFHFVVKTDPIVIPHNLLLGVIDDETKKNLRVDWSQE